MEDFLIELVPPEKQEVFSRYFQLYLYEHSIFTGNKPINGIFQYPWFETYWQEDESRWPFWMRNGEDVAAFAFVRFDDNDLTYEMAEFWVANQYRGQGLGDRLAKYVLLRFGGRWKLNQVKRNERAIAFWSRLLDEIVDFVETPLKRSDQIERVEQRFVIGGEVADR